MSVQTTRRPSTPAPDGNRGPQRSSRPAAAAAPPKPKKRKDPLWAKLTIVFGAVLMMAGGAGVAGTKWLVSNATSAVTQENLLGGTVKKSSEGGGDIKGPVDILLMGVDARKRWAVDDLRSDTIIALHIPASHDQAYLVSIPRDTEMRVPAFPKAKYAGGTAKATEVFFHGAQNGGGWAGGAQLMAQTIKENTGMSFDGAAIIDFNGFKSVIDALKGVHMCVDQRVKSHHMKLVDGKPMYLAEARKVGGNQKEVWHEKGCRDMEGWEALDYARQRYGLKNGDYDRQRHQQQLIKAIAKKAASSGVMTNPVKVNNLIKAAGKAFVLDTGDVPVADFIFGLKGVAANDMVLLRTNNGTFAGNGNGRETITPKSMEMYRAVKQDKLSEFILANPDVVANEK
ncbi:transcriptional regulator [Actinoplanes sp. NBRC 14428]|uniref:LytR family transcriptional attenuator n=1 Tax=Pseudosporangium ferrugineum TaxID=439699 RepID=A0A2T0S1J1_9ACTN|nr:LCP family protein [Pseudosporangium ferrugineum]PRY27278.1 LytR family transcriptional attenuator [Pseudosporangium ferrugineum]BCJ53338.1 transcriptional regulator [Actinoplanes sp. NBRC 14428]